MRIAVVHNQPSGGARRALHGFCATWRARHSIDVFTTDRADDEWLRDDDVADAVVRVPMRRRRPVRMGLYLNDLARRNDLRDLVTTYRTIASAIDDGGYDVVFVDACRYALVPPVTDALATPSVVYVHNGPASLEGGTWDSARTAWARGRSAWHAPFERAHERRLAVLQQGAARAATRVIANSGHTAARLRRAWGVRAVVRPPGVDLPAPPNVERGDFVLSVGEIEPRKGFGFVIDALAHVGEAVRPPLVVVANRANPVELARVRARAAASGVELVVELDPPAEVLWSRYERARVFVYGAHREALGLSPLEAMARATPVVAVAEGGVVETVVDGVTGALTPRAPEVFGAALGSLLCDPARLERYGAAARRHVDRNWRMETRARALEDVLTAVAREREIVS